MDPNESRMAMYSRRTFISAVPGIGLAVAGSGLLVGKASGAEDEPPRDTSWPGFPRQHPDLVRETVGASHRDRDRVYELVHKHPALANATWDWGFGDWETALGAASHTGRREIAELLIEHGARIDIFAATMLGYTEVVRSLVVARPGIQRTLGPHGITLLAHARAGGEPAAGTLTYLESLGDADQPTKTEPIEAESRDRFVGRYEIESPAGEGIEVRLDKDRNLMLAADGQAARRMHYVGNDAFFPAGVPGVRIQFVGEGAEMTLSIIDDATRVLARRR